MRNLLISFIGVIGGWSPQSVPFRGMFILFEMFRASSPNSDDGWRSLTTELQENEQKYLENGGQANTTADRFILTVNRNWLDSWLFPYVDN